MTGKRFNPEAVVEAYIYERWHWNWFFREIIDGWDVRGRLVSGGEVRLGSLSSRADAEAVLRATRDVYGLTHEEGDAE